VTKSIFFEPAKENYAVCDIRTRKLTTGPVESNASLHRLVSDYRVICALTSYTGRDQLRPQCSHRVSCYIYLYYVPAPIGWGDSALMVVVCLYLSVCLSGKYVTTCRGRGHTVSAHSRTHSLYTFELNVSHKSQ